MRITSAGNVGIGTASPATKLDVANSNIQITNTAWKSSSEQVAGNLKFNLGGSSSERANSVAEIIGLDTTTSQYNGALAFNTLGSNTSAERMRIDSSGNVGIGTESPSSLLHISKDGGSGGVVSTIENTNAAFSSSYSGLTLKTGLNTAEIKAVSGAGGAGYLSGTNVSITTDASTDTVTINSDAAASIGVSVINSDTTAAADNLYVLTANLTLTLPSSPSAGDSIKISNRSAVETCVIARNGSNIMGSAANLTLDNATSSFELIYSDATNGWVIIGQ